MSTRRPLIFAVLVSTCLYPLIFQARAEVADVPRIVWASDPVGPDETVLLTGGPFGADSTVSFSVVANLPSARPAAWKGATENKFSTIIPLQITAQSIKFVIPRNSDKGIYICRVESNGKSSSETVLNAPAPWWIQGDQGSGATAGGWVRVLGKSLHLTADSSIVLEDAAHNFSPKIQAFDAVKEIGAQSGYALQASVPAQTKPGIYTLHVQNGCGGDCEWGNAGKIEIRAPEAWPPTVFDVLDFYGDNADKELQRTIRRGSKPVDRTQAIDAALAKAKANGGGIVYFREGIYAYAGELKIPARTVLKGEGMGVVSLWFGSGQLALDGGGAQDKTRQQIDIKPLPPALISGSDCKLESFSMYIPLECNMAISAGDNFSMDHVRIRVDRYWGRPPERQNGTLIKLKNNFSVLHCDILAKASAIILGHYGIVANNTIRAGKINCELGHSSHVIVEDNLFISLDPTAYNNVYEEGRNIYYARNRHESMYVHQSDFSFTFDGLGGCYLGKLSSVEETHVMLEKAPEYPKWAGEKSSLWRNSVVCILSGKGAGQYRFITGNEGQRWGMDRPFLIVPDADSIVSIVPYRGQLLVIGNRFEDANWINMGYGSSFDVICAGNSLYRCGQLLNYGLNLDSGRQPSWYVQYLYNDIYEGHTLIQTFGMAPRTPSAISANPVTRATIHRGQHLHADNSGFLEIDGDATDCIVEHCKFENQKSTLNAKGHPVATLFRDNSFENGSPRYAGKALGEILIVPPLPK